MYRELVEKDIRNRGTIKPAGEIFPTAANHLRYCSLFMFGHDILAYVKTNISPTTGQPSVLGYKGKVYADAIWIDIDCKDVEAARQSAIQVIRRLNTDYQVNPEHLYIYFSGNKGFHIAIHSRIVGFDAATAVDPEKVKDFVRRLTVNIPHVDFVIYEPVRIFRVENSQHEKSGLYKVRISYDELQCDVEDIKKLAAKPRSYPFKTDWTGFGFKENLNKLWLNSGAYVQEQKEFEHSGNLFQAPREGSRNKTLLVQACTLFRKSELSSNAVLDIISNAAYIANIGSKDPVDKQELKRIVSNAERLVGEERKKPLEESLQIKSFGEWVPEWENYVLQEQTEMSLVFQDMNSLMHGRLKGKLGVVIGYGGSKKSLYALNVCLHNMKKTDAISIYSTMEMSVPQLMNRIIDHEVYVDGQTSNASDVLAGMYRKDVNQGRKFLVDQLSKEVGNRLQLTPNSRMTYEHYKKAIQKVKETVGTPSILVVDGLSMMGGKGTETEVYSRNSAELKELANEENMFVLLICHVSKGAELYTRDLSRNIRGSEKILDNCDFYMTMSQIQDSMQPELYEKNKGFVNFHDKRGSGEMVNLVYSFDPQRLRLSDSPEDPKLYLEPVMRKGKSLLEQDF